MKIQDEIYKMWMLRDQEHRIGNEAERLSDEAWDNDLQLNRNKNTHYQLVMQLVRRTLVN